MDRYRRFRALPAAELEVLPVAVLFGAAYRTAIRVHLAQDSGWGGSIQRGLQREQARIAVSGQIASRAQAIIGSR